MQSLGNPYTGLFYYPGISFAPRPLIGSISYPPLSAFIFGLTYRLYLLLGEPSRYVYYLLLKQPMVLSDIAIAIVIAKIVLISKSQDTAKFISLIWLYLPFGIIVSSVWGALDPVALLLLLLATYEMLTSRPVLSAVFLGLGIFLKTIPVIALPLLLIQVVGVNRKLRYAGISLAIPTLGTLAPIFILNWGLKGILDNFSFQVDSPSDGAMSLVGQLFQISKVSGVSQQVVAIIWIPTLIMSYIYIYHRRPSLLSGLLISTLSFSLSRVFLPEQWALYPSALLLTLADKTSLKHFLGVSISSTAFLIANNTWLIRFLTPISASFYTWTPFVSSAAYVVGQAAIVLAMSGLFFAEATLIVTGRESIVCKAMINMSANLKIQLPNWLRLQPELETH